MLRFAKRLFSNDIKNAIKTPLYPLHLELKGKMVEFAGYALPVQYEGIGIIKVLIINLIGTYVCS